MNVPFFQHAVRSIRWRLQLWYAGVLLAIVGGFAAIAFYQARAMTYARVDLQLTAAVNYLDVTLKTFPPDELEGSESRQGAVDDDFRFQPAGRPPPPPHGPPETRGEAGSGEDGGGDAEPAEPAVENGPPPAEPPPPRPAPHDAEAPPRHNRPPFGPSSDSHRPPPRRPRHQNPARSVPDLQRLLDLRRPFSGEAPDPVAEELYFTVWRGDGSILKSQSPQQLRVDERLLQDPPPANSDLRITPRGTLREAVRFGPRHTVILVGKSIGRERAELTRFGATLLGAGCVALAVGLAGGWVISARVLQPVSAISTTATSISASQLSKRIDPETIDVELVGLAHVLNEMFERLEGAFERQRRFTSDASHELRTPLTILYTNIELALARERSGEEYRETLRSGLAAASRMRTLVEGLLALARVDAGRLDVTLNPIDLGRVAADAAAQLAPTADKAKVRLLYDRTPEPVRLVGDATLLGRVASNLLSNAIRHTLEGGEVRITVTQNGSSVSMTVSDTGKGIPLEAQPRIFERFFRADSSRARMSGGHGLGLSICRGFVEAHGGTISFTSKPGQGTTFVVRLPLRPSY